MTPSEKSENTKMKSTWNNRQGNRDRQAVAVLVTADGRVHKFTGASLPGVCQSSETDREKNGKWSNSTFEVLHHDTTSFVGWSQDWDTGETFPQVSWDAGFLWLKTAAPAVTMSGFESFIREGFPKTAARWDAVSAAEVEFSTPATADQLAAIEAGKAEVARLTEKADAARKAADALASVNQEVKWAAEEAARQAARLAEETAIKAKSVAGLGNSLGNAFAKLGK